MDHVKEKISIFLVESDNLYREHLKSALEAASFFVYNYDSYDSVIKGLEQNKPHILVTASTINEHSGWELCERLKNDPEYNVPVIIIGHSKQEEKIQYKLVGADSYILRSIPVKNIAQNIKMVYKSFQKKRRTTRKISFSGNLNRIPLIEILQSMHNYAQSGCLMTQRNALVGKIFINNGNVYHAEIPNFSGENALFYLLCWNKGHFKFKQGEHVEEKTIFTEIESLFFEGMRISDEIIRIKKAFLDQQISDFLVLETLLFTKTISTNVIQKLLDKIINNKTSSLIDFLIEKNLASFKDIQGAKYILSQLHSVGVETKQITDKNKLFSKYTTELDEILLQRLVFSFSLLTMQQMDLCFKEKARTSRSLSDIMVSKGFLDHGTIVNLMCLRDEEGLPIIEYYEMEQKIAQGSRSIVYEAISLERQKKVAVKVFVPHLEGNDNSIQRLIREAEVSSTLDHPFITKTLDFGEKNGIYFIVSELVDGLSLQEIINNNGVLAVENVLELMRQTATALVYIWKKGYVHRDIKPQNIIVSNNKIKLCDFGLTKKIKEPEEKLTMDGVVVGTPGYIPPEYYKDQITKFENDVYSFGVTIYHSHIKVDNVIFNPSNIFFPPKTCNKFIQLIKKFTNENPKNRASSIDEVLLDIQLVQNGKYPAGYSQMKKWKRFFILPVTIILLLLLVSNIFYVQRTNSNKNKIKELTQRYLIQAKENEKKAYDAFLQKKIIISEKHIKTSFSFYERAIDLGSDVNISAEKWVTGWFPIIENNASKNTINSLEKAQKICQTISNIRYLNKRQKEKVFLLSKEIKVLFLKKIKILKEQEKLNQYVFFLKKTWLGKSKKTKSNKNFKAKKPIYIHYILSVKNSQKNYPVTLSVEKNNQTLWKKTIFIDPGKKLFHYTARIPNIKTGKHTIISRANSFSFSFEKKILLSVVEKKKKKIKWLKKTSLFEKNYLKRLKKWKVLSGGWAPAEEKFGVYGMGTGKISVNLEKKPWKINGVLHFKFSNKEGGLCIDLKKRSIFLSIQPTKKNKYVILLIVSPSWNLFSKEKKIIHSKILETKSENISYEILCLNNEIILNIDKSKFASIKLKNKPKKFGLFTKNAQALHFVKLNQQYGEY